MELSVLSDVPLLQNEGETGEETDSPQLRVLTKNDDGPVSVRRGEWLECVEHLQLVGEQGAVKTLVEENVNLCRRIP